MAQVCSSVRSVLHHIAQLCFHEDCAGTHPMACSACISEDCPYAVWPHPRPLFLHAGYSNLSPVLQGVTPIDADGTPILVPATAPQAISPPPVVQPPPAAVPSPPVALPVPPQSPATAVPVPAAAPSSHTGIIAGVTVGVVAALVVALGACPASMHASQAMHSTEALTAVKSFRMMQLNINRHELHINRHKAAMIVCIPFCACLCMPQVCRPSYHPLLLLLYHAGRNCSGCCWTLLLVGCRLFLVE